LTARRLLDRLVFGFIQTLAALAVLFVKKSFRNEGNARILPSSAEIDFGLSDEVFDYRIWIFLALKALFNGLIKLAAANL
jgi:hypothetical protein